MSLSGKKWNLYKTSNSILQSDFISCIGVDSSNKKWIGTSAGLFTYDGTTWQDFSSNLPDPHVTAILFDKAGSVWIGTYGGLVKFSNSTWSVYSINNSGLKENLVTCLTEDNTGKIWVGTPHNYINIFDGKNWKYYDNTNINSRITGVGADAFLIQSMAIDNKGIIWVSFQSPAGGAIVLTFDGSTWNIITGMSYFGGSYPLAMYSKGDFLIFGNYNGLSVQNNTKNSFSYYKTANSGLQLFRLQAVTMDNQNNIWVGSFFYGIGKFKSVNF
jgi:ligand-binding sensor domain-containing protein